MHAQLLVMSIEGKHYASGVIYTPDGIQQYNGIVDKFEDLLHIKPTFATQFNCVHDECCKKNMRDVFYYLTYDNVDDLKKMLTFMSGESLGYLFYVPSYVINELGIKFAGDEISFSDVHIPRREQIPCEFLGSIPTNVTLIEDKVYVNGVNINRVALNIDEVRKSINSIFIQYLINYYKGALTWGTVLRMWCGIRIS